MTDETAPPPSQSYLLSTEDKAFLFRDEMRSTRLALEFQKVDLLLRDWRIRSTIVVFGSSRASSLEQTDKSTREARRSEAANIVERRTNLSFWYEEARTFGRIVSERGGALAPDSGERRNVIATGGGPGIMEAANRGAADAGAPSIGFNIALPAEQRPNVYSTPELTFQFRYFAVRKMHFAMRASALAFFPGGFGTMDELFEILTLMQTSKVPPMPVVLFGREYWQTIIDFPSLARQGTIEEEHITLFEMVDRAEEGWDVMLRRGLETGPAKQDI